MGDVTLTLTETRAEAADTLSFLFSAEGLQAALPGQYLIVKLDVPDDPRRGTRSFTMANSPTEGRVMVTTRIRASSPFKRKLASLRPGDAVPAKGPLGKFTLHEDDASALFLAGGIGVTPFRAMIKASIDLGRTTPVKLLTSDRTPTAIPYRDELEGWARAHPWLTVLRTVTRPEARGQPWDGRAGRIDEAWIRQAMREPDRTVAYVAGPPAFVEAMTALVKAIGLPPERVKFERFTGY